MKHDDAELLRLYVEQGSQGAFRQIVERHTPRVYAICYRRLHDSQLAEDALQQVFLDLARQAGRIEPGPLEGLLALNLTPVAVRKRLMRALAQLRERMGESGGGLTLSLVAGLLGNVDQPLPPPGLASRVASYILSHRAASSAGATGAIPKLKPILP